MIKPMLCKLQTEAFNNPDYIWEPKFDGIRIIANVKDGKADLQARSGTNKTLLFPDIKIQTVNDTSVVLDGEIISGNGFNDIQHRTNRENGIAQAVKDYPARYAVFDILEVAGNSVRHYPLSQRKELLKGLLVESENITLSSYVTDGKALFDLMKANKLEGVVGKNLSGVYHENAREWLKVKCWQEGVYYVVGYTAGTGWRTSTFGALVLTDKNAVYVGSVGTGFDNAEIARLVKFMARPFPSTAPPTPPWASRVGEPVTWVHPFGVKIKFLEQTNDGMLRFPAYKGVV